MESGKRPAPKQHTSASLALYLGKGERTKWKEVVHGELCRAVQGAVGKAVQGAVGRVGGVLGCAGW